MAASATGSSGVCVVATSGSRLVTIESVFCCVVSEREDDRLTSDGDWGTEGPAKSHGNQCQYRVGDYTRIWDSCVP
jgi:hypothetical protein